MIRTGAVLLLAPLIAAQNPPTFHSDTHLEQVNVVVHEKNRAVANLTRDDFTITDRGTPRAISVFSVSSTAHAPTPTAPLPANTFSNLPHAAAAASGVTIILLDGMNTLYFNKDPFDLFMDTLRTDAMALSFARRQVIKFVQAIQPGDRVAIYSLGRSLQVLCDFTGDSAQLQKILAAYQAIPAVKGDDADPLPSNLPDSADFNPAIDAANRQTAAIVNTTRAGSTTEALRAIAAHVSAIPGRKNLIWLTASMPFSGEAVARIVSPANIAVYPVDARGLATSFNSNFAGRGNAIPRGPDLAAGQGEMRAVAQQTGGVAYVNNNDLSGAIRKAIDDASVTYTLGFYVDSKSLDGKFHELKIRVKDPGADVRYPRGYYAFDQPPAPENNVQRVVLSPLESAEVHLLARIDRTNPPPSFNVSGSIDLRNIDLRPQGSSLTGTVEIYLIQQNAAGDVLDKTREKLNLSLSRDQYAAYLKSGVFFRKVISARPHAATLRVVAGDPRTAKMGSLIIPIASLQ